MLVRPILLGLAVTLAANCSQAAAALQTAPAQSAAYASAAAGREPEDPALVWTPASVALVSQPVGAGVWAVFPDNAADKAVRGVPVATSGGIVVGSRGVLVVDTMINRNLAGQMMDLVAEASPLPILYAVNTSYHGDHSYGNQFLPADTEVIQHRNTQAYVQGHFADDVAFMSQYFGRQSGLDELTPQPADILLGDGETRRIDLGGISVEIFHLGFAQTTGDLFVWVPSAKVLFTGNPIISGGPSFPWLLDGRAGDALTTLRQLRDRFPADTVVIPGHGEPTDMAALDRHIAYLEQLQAEAAAAVREGLTLEQATTRMDERMKGQWGGYAIYPWVHVQLNVAKAFAEAGGH